MISSRSPGKSSASSDSTQARVRRAVARGNNDRDRRPAGRRRGLPRDDLAPHQIVEESQQPGGRKAGLRGDGRSRASAVERLQHGRGLRVQTQDMQRAAGQQQRAGGVGRETIPGLRR
jgi:hypothetical protein